MKLLFAIGLLLISNLGIAQTYTQAQLINTARSHLNAAVGVELSKYFVLDKDSYYEYKTKTGKTKWRAVMRDKQTKGSFVQGNGIRFKLNHPEFPYRFVNVWVKLNSNMGLAKDIDISRVPDFLIDSNQPKWL